MLGGSRFAMRTGFRRPEQKSPRCYGTEKTFDTAERLSVLRTRLWALRKRLLYWRDQFLYLRHACLYWRDQFLYCRSSFWHDRFLYWRTQFLYWCDQSWRDQSKNNNVIFQGAPQNGSLPEPNWKVRTANRKKRFASRTGVREPRTGRTANRIFLAVRTGGFGSNRGSNRKRTAATMYEHIIRTLSAPY